MNTNSDDIGLENIPLYKEVGFDYVELPLAQLMTLNDKSFSQVLKLLEEVDICCRACNNFIPATIRMTGPDINMVLLKDYVKSAMARAAALGAQIIVLGSSGARNVPPGFPKEDALEQFIDNLGWIGDIAKEFNITVAIEHLNKSESNLITTLYEGLHLVRRLNHSNIRCLIDSYHLDLGNEVFPVEKNLPIAHVHFARTLGRSFPEPMEREEYCTFFSNLKSIGYKGGVSIEAYARDISSQCFETVKLLRSIMGVVG